jgi:hypothetical protein
MKLINFDYTKTDNSTTNRTLIVLSSASEFVEGIDLGELSEEDQALCALEMMAVHTRYQEQLNEVIAKHDVRNRYRRFIPKQMSNITTESM